MGFKIKEDIAKDRIKKLFNEARKAAKEDKIKRANHYVELARKIGMKCNISIPSKYRRRFCKECYSYLKPGKTCRVRLKNGVIVTKCLNCSHINRFVIK